MNNSVNIKSYSKQIYLHHYKQNQFVFFSTMNVNKMEFLIWLKELFNLNVRSLNVIVTNNQNKKFYVFL